MRLVVLSPAIHSDVARWSDLRRRLANEPGYGPTEAEWLVVQHNTRMWSPGSVTAIAENLANRINQQWEKTGGYDDVVLVGHSLGGLVVRRAYLFGVEKSLSDTRVEWAKRVSRIVLFAALNRGVDPSRKMGFGFAVWATRVLPLPHLRIEDAIIGSTFLTNLRIDWIRHFTWLAGRTREPAPDDMRVPEVVQLVGDLDGIVSRDDSRDILAFGNAAEIQIPDADHRTLYRTNESSDPAGRYALIRPAFAGESEPKAGHDSEASSAGVKSRLRAEPVGATERSVPTAPSPRKGAANAIARPVMKGGAALDPRDPVKHVIFILHGIRASNVDGWVEHVQKLIHERRVPGVRTTHPSYGYFTAVRFALPSVRRRNTAKFRDWYTELLADYPGADFSIIAHSNGTYMLGQTLKVTPGMRFKNIVLAGSVLPTLFPWNALMGRGQVERVLNERANRDWPVALLCNFLRGLLQKDIGPAGFTGFEGQDVTEVAYHPGDHGAALRGKNPERLVTFALEGDCGKAEGLERVGFYRQLSNFAPWAGRIGGVVVLGLLVFWIASAPFDDMLDRAGVVALFLGGLYVLLDII